MAQEESEWFCLRGWRIEAKKFIQVRKSRIVNNGESVVVRVMDTYKHRKEAITRERIHALDSFTLVRSHMSFVHVH
ncbi:hypothetical protein KQX54_018297 [Cotesia glomerata]|uniref:Uncharacterized protein n=1 Tax=Cotesia glomerata TaxID=32391 RepID=A0AAV7ID67_COTGL|nr:hypothetical protein KQX54_018297 [Cotesia glomerata]